MTQQDITLILGPTASGKSELAIEIAKKNHGEIISADAYQIYQHLTIGTAKVSSEVRRQIPHHLIDIKHPTDTYNVTDFLKDTHQIIHTLRCQNKSIIICGGTGLYIRSFLFDYQFPPKTKTSPFKVSQQDANHDLWNQLNQIDSKTAQKIPKQNRRRIIRALEIYYDTKQKPSLIKQQADTIRTDTKLIGIHYERPLLIQRINNRVDLMIEQGLVNEVTDLLNKGVPKTAQSLQAIGYKEIVSYLENELTLDEAIRLIKVRTRQLAKRQMTWFRKIPNIHWIHRSS